MNNSFLSSAPLPFSPFCPCSSAIARSALLPILSLAEGEEQLGQTLDDGVPGEKVGVEDLDHVPYRLAMPETLHTQQRMDSHGRSQQSFALTWAEQRKRQSLFLQRRKMKSPASSHLDDDVEEAVVLPLTVDQAGRPCHLL